MRIYSLAMGSSMDILLLAIAVGAVAGFATAFDDADALLLLMLMLRLLRLRLLLMLNAASVRLGYLPTVDGTLRPSHSFFTKFFASSNISAAIWLGSFGHVSSWHSRKYYTQKKKNWEKNIKSVGLYFLSYNKRRFAWKQKAQQQQQKFTY